MANQLSASSASQLDFKDNDGTYDLLAFNDFRSSFQLCQQGDVDGETVIHHENLFTAKSSGAKENNFVPRREDTFLPLNVALASRLCNSHCRRGNLTIAIVGDERLRSEIIDLIYLKQYAYIPHIYLKSDNDIQFTSLLQIQTLSTDHYYVYYNYHRFFLEGSSNCTIHLHYHSNFDQLWASLSPQDQNTLLTRSARFCPQSPEEL